jgi:hypothetical protein
MPMLPLGLALRAVGDTVLVAGQPDVAGAAHDGGLSAVIVGEDFHATELSTAALLDGQRPVSGGRPSAAQQAAGARVWIMHARYHVRSYLAVARSWAPDLIVSDTLDYAGPIVAGVLGIPAVQHRWGMDTIATAAWAPARRTLQGLCQRVGLPDGLPAPDMILDPCPPGLQDPGVPAGRPIRPVPSNGCGTLPDWAMRRGRRRRVCVSLGHMTLALNGVGLLRALVEGCSRLADTETVITAASAFRAQLAKVPASVRLVDPLPLDLFLHTCDAVIHHGGGGTALAAAVFGLPQVVLPQYADAFDTADRIEACGIGVRLDDAALQDDPGQIAEAVRAVLSEPRYGAAARELRTAITRMPSPADLVPSLHALAAGDAGVSPPVRVLAGHSPANG